MYYSIVLLLFSFIFSQTINHDPIEITEQGLPLEISVFTDLQGQNIKSFNLFYKNSNQTGYFKENLLSEDGVYYTSRISSDFIGDSDIYYYIYLETEVDIFTLPIINPELNPYRINVLEQEQDTNNEILFSNTVSHINILTPQHNEKILSDDLVISVSYFEHDDIDISSIKILLDDMDLTEQASIKENYLILVPSEKIQPGIHNLKLSFANNIGVYFKPIIWSFTIIEQEKKEYFTYSGKVWNDYTDNNIDGYTASYNTSNMNFSIKTEWMNFNFKGRENSLENPLEQSKNRYSISMKNKYIDINYGDFYPQFDPITLNGNRVRGLGFNLNTKFFQMNMIKGELNRAIQGDLYNSLELLYSQEYDVDNEEDYNQLTIDRKGYTFQNDLTALRLSAGNKDRFNWGLNLVKVKDNIESVNSMVDGAVIDLDALTEKYNSDWYIDTDDSDGEYNAEVDILVNDENGVFDDLEPINDIPEFIINEELIVIVSYCSSSSQDCGEYEGYPIKQKIRRIEILYDDLGVVLDHPDFSLFDNELNWSENLLTDNWSNTPTDNLVLGTDFKLNTNKVKLNAGIAFSAFNNNIWSPAMTDYELDTINDDHQDCYINRSYSNLPITNDCTDDIDNCNVGDYYWSDCLAYIFNGGDVSDDDLIDLIFIESGVETFNPSDLQNLFHINSNINLPSIVDGESGTGFSDILNYPEVAYDFDVRLVYPKQNIHFGIKKVGKDFNSLGNSYLQSDTKETYISDRFKLLNNRMFLLLSWKSIDNGLINKTSESDKYDINISYYPRPNFPSFTINYGLYDKSSGSPIFVYAQYDEFGSSDCDDPDTVEQEECFEEDAIDFTNSSIETNTKNLNININYNFNLFKVNHNLGLSSYNSDTKDLLLEALSTTPNYISPSSISNNYNLSLRSFISEFLNTDCYFSNSSYVYSKEEFSAYQEQDIFSTRLGLNYYNNKLVDKIGVWIDYSKGKGTSSYSQYGLKLLINMKLFNNFFMDINLRHYNRKIVNDDDYKNSILKANISYNF